jgi:hypothetical protein
MADLRFCLADDLAVFWEGWRRSARLMTTQTAPLSTRVGAGRREARGNSLRPFRGRLARESVQSKCGTLGTTISGYRAILCVPTPETVR